LAGFGTVMSINHTIKTRMMMKIKEEHTTLTSHRSEAYGLLCALTMYNEGQEFTKFRTGERSKTTTTVYTNSESLVKTVNQLCWQKIYNQFQLYGGCGSY
jgi:hypothetical protein